MSTQTEIPQTLTTMEAGFTLVPGTEDEFWGEQARIGPVVAGKPGFAAVIGGPIYNSGWLYFSGRFDTPAHMDQWHHDPDHSPVQQGARSTWFGAYYIRKWRRPAAGEPLAERIWSETAISRDAPLSDQELEKLVGILDSLQAAGAMPYETLVGEFEPQPFQLVGPLQEFPQLAPVRYLVVAHWNSSAAFNAWRESPALAELGELGEVKTVANISIAHAQDERVDLNADGTHRQWVRH
jgi:hypothetical protein